MPLDWLNRFTPTGFRYPREVAERCNSLGDAVAASVASIESRLDLLETIILDLVPAAYGGMTLASPPVAGSIPTVGFAAITQYDTVDITGRGCTFNATNGTVSINTNVTGVWQFSFEFALSHDESNQGRDFEFRFFNVTDGTQEGNAIYIPVGRNQPGTTWGITFLANILSADAGKEFRGELGNASAAISLVEFEALSFDAHFTDRLGDLIDPFTD